MFKKVFLTKKGFPLPFNIVVVVAIIAALGTSIYKVDKEENATICRFGKYIKTTEPGVHGKLPWPIEAVQKTAVTKVHRMVLGFRVDESGKYKVVPAEASMLTGDDNVVEVSAVVQYKSVDAYKWQFVVEEPDRLLYFLSQSAMRLIIGQSTFDRAATNDKAGVQFDIKEKLQELCDDIDFGAKIVSFQLQDVSPPRVVVPAFDAVVDAREKKAELIFDADKYANKILPDARGEAQQMINDAKGYAARRVADAEGDVKKFVEVLAKYEVAPKITRERLIFEAQEDIIPGADIVIDRGGENGILKFLNLQNNNTDAPQEVK